MTDWWSKREKEWERTKAAKAEEARAQINAESARVFQDLIKRKKMAEVVPPGWADNPDGYYEWLEGYKKQKAKDSGASRKPRPGLNP